MNSRRMKNTDNITGKRNINDRITATIDLRFVSPVTCLKAFQAAANHIAESEHSKLKTTL
jgi:hypothetical protein